MSTKALKGVQQTAEQSVVMEGHAIPVPVRETQQSATHKEELSVKFMEAFYAYQQADKNAGRRCWQWGQVAIELKPLYTGHWLNYLQVQGIPPRSINRAMVVAGWLTLEECDQYGLADLEDLARSLARFGIKIGNPEREKLIKHQIMLMNKQKEAKPKTAAEKKAADEAKEKAKDPWVRIDRALEDVRFKPSDDAVKNAGELLALCGGDKLKAMKTIQGIVVHKQ